MFIAEPDDGIRSAFPFHFIASNHTISTFSFRHKFPMSNRAKNTSLDKHQQMAIEPNASFARNKPNLHVVWPQKQNVS